MVQNARGIANCARAQEGGGRAEPLALFSMLSSMDTRVQTARYGSSRRRCSFLAAAAPASPISGLYRFYKLSYLGRSRVEPLCIGAHTQTACCWVILVAYFWWPTCHGVAYFCGQLNFHPHFSPPPPRGPPGPGHGAGPAPSGTACTETPGKDSNSTP